MDDLRAIRARAAASRQALASGTTGTTPMDIDGLSIHDALDIVSESAADIPALIAEVERLRADVPTEDVARVLREQYDQWLLRMHGIDSSCDHSVEAEHTAKALLAHFHITERQR